MEVQMADETEKTMSAATGTSNPEGGDYLAGMLPDDDRAGKPDGLADQETVLKKDKDGGYTHPV